MYDHFRCAALPSDLQLQQLWLRPLDDSDVLDQQAEHTLAITCFGGRSGPQSWEVAGQLQDLSLLFGADGAQRLTLEVGELRLEVEHALCRIIPALLEGAGDCCGDRPPRSAVPPNQPHSERARSAAAIARQWRDRALRDWSGPS